MTARRASGQPASRAAYFKAVRLALGLRLTTLAKVSGFSASYIAAIESEERPLLPHVEKALRSSLEREQQRVYRDAERLEAA